VSSPSGPQQQSSGAGSQQEHVAASFVGLSSMQRHAAAGAAGKATSSSASEATKIVRIVVS
jgi:hypothetical protein